MTALTPVTRLCRTRPVSGIWIICRLWVWNPCWQRCGRHKTLFRTAAYLLPLPELRAVLEQLGSEPGLRELPPKERARTAETLLRAAADRQGLELKLRRNPKTQS